MTEAELDDLVHRFESCAIPRGKFTHADHLRIGASFVRRHGADAALQRLRTGIRALNASNGIQNSATEGYHETITVAYVRLIATALELPMGESTAFADRVQAIVDGQLGEKWVLLRFWSRDAILCSAARLAWVEPDVAPLESARSELIEPPIESPGSRRIDQPAV